jgi:hypothetical protein
MITVRGTFDVQLEAAGDEGPVGRMTIQKRFHGPLSGTSAGQMLALRTVIPGSAAYVALEVVDGTLEGRRGGFALQHRGTMDRGASDLWVGVVPDSGTGDLEGLTGRMRIEIVDGQHNYEFDYELTAPTAAQ